MNDKARIRAEATRLLAYFEAAGATVVETDILQPADVLLDLYGEDIRARAFVSHDPVYGEQMLRPDFTVPVVQMHMNGGAEPARYTYCGPVFRRQTDPGQRPKEYLQVGYEIFERANPAASDAEAFSLIFKVLAPMGLRVSTGDIGVLMAAVQGLGASERRKAALLRHIWRPARFHALLQRYAGLTQVPESRAKMLAASDPLADAPPLVGLRSRAEISERIDILRRDAEEPPISGDDVRLLDRILGFKGKYPAAASFLGDIAGQMPALRAVSDSFAARMEALNACGMNVDGLEFDASYGRSAMEYYDGFVFGFRAQSRDELPPVATGGRYDALARVLGKGRAIPAVGGVIRPGLLVEVAR